jgi:hypothetical protein
MLLQAGIQAIFAAGRRLSCYNTVQGLKTCNVFDPSNLRLTAYGKPASKTVFTIPHRPFSLPHSMWQRKTAFLWRVV